VGLQKQWGLDDEASTVEMMATAALRGWSFPTAATELGLIVWAKDLSPAKTTS